MHLLTNEQLKTLFDKYCWREAVTYRNTHPHEYLLLKDVSDEDKNLFPDIAHTIRETGYEYLFYQNVFYCLNLNGYRYWTMDYPFEKTDLINRTIDDGTTSIN